MDGLAPGSIDDAKDGECPLGPLHIDCGGTTCSSCYSTAFGEETASIYVDEEPPFPLRSYSSDGGDFLHIFRPPNQTETVSIHCYSPWTIRGDDEFSLVVHVEVEDEEKGFTLGICGATESVVGTFLQYFSSGQTMHPMGTQEVRRLCICPWHRRAVLLALLDDRIISCVYLPSAEFCLLRNGKGREEAGLTQESSTALFEPAPIDVDAWRVVVEHKGRGFVRFYAVERRKGSCYCDAPLSQLS
ncbi:hypothetical protein MOQ_004428 [Trypanosoma cruzi marinkellei]|uniref:Uncharacterized protein n=1 Tax=Trypanosoma cruzi marinkellei TaxID=85056 RepID=K2NRW7_TRYCR|nr:hypothetical protein MOQ_004428 [Trypanosoma cruzi marinkellei]